MRKFLFCCLAVFVFCMPANAVQQCVPYEFSDCVLGVATDYSPDWSFSCSGPINITVSGLGLCASGINMINDDSVGKLNGTHCVCKALKPMPSKWVLAATANSVDACQKTCAKICASFIAGGDITQQIVETMAR